MSDMDALFRAVERMAALPPVEAGDVTIAYPKEVDGGYQVIVLDRVVPGKLPDHCVHGRVTCYGDCGEWLWLGDQSIKVVRDDGAVPLCQECATKQLADAGVDARRVRDNIGDHLRKDGPHDG